MQMIANWSFPNEIRFGAGRIRELAQACSSSGISRPLFVTDKGMTNLPATALALDVLDDAGLGRELFGEVDPNPTDLNLNAGIAVFRDGEFDGIVAFGGGSAIDLGKMIAFMAGQTRPIWDFEDKHDWWTRADSSVISPIVAVPTTAGTGSEVGRASVITNSDTRAKKIIFHPRVLPTAVIADPELTLELPPAMTAGTGMDAFAHCLEAYCSPSYHPMCEGIALEGMRLVKENLPRAYKFGKDIEARSNMMSAASMGAVAFQKGLGAIHAISHPVGAVYNTHHGTTNAAVMPAVLAFNRPAIENRIASAAAYIGTPEGFDGFYSYVLELKSTLNVPSNLLELGVDINMVDDLARRAIEDPAIRGNPVKMTFESTRDLYLRCFQPIQA